MPVLFNKATAREEFVPNEAVQAALASGKFEAPGGAKVAITTPQGRVVQATPEDVAAAGPAGGLRASTAGELGTAEESAFLQQEHGGLAGGAGAFVEGAVDAATLGGYGALTNALDSRYTEDRAARREANPIAATAGDVVGTVAPALLSGGTGAAATAARFTPAGLASRAGDLIVKAGRAGGLVEAGAAAGAGYAVEGALYGAGHVLSESVLKDKELSAEAFLAGAGQGALWGGLTGAGATLFGRGASAARGKLDGLASRSKELTTLQAEHKIALKEAQREQRLADRLRVEQERHLNRAGLEQLKQKGKLELVEARGSVQTEVAGIGAETRLKVADKRMETELAKAEAKAAVAKAKVEKVSEALQIEQAKLERAKLVMDGRIQLSETYTSGWRKAADSREVVASSKLEAAGVTADAKLRTGLADALVSSKRPDAGYLVEELIPAKMRSTRAVETAKGGVLNHAAEMTSATDDLVRQADEIMAANPAAAADLKFMRDRAAAASPKVSEWAEKQASSKAFQAQNLDDLKAAGFSGPAEPPAALVPETFDDPFRFLPRSGTNAAEEFAPITQAASPDTARAAGIYTSSDYRQISGYLRGRKPETQFEINTQSFSPERVLDEYHPSGGMTVREVVGHLDDLLSKSAAPSDMLVYRGVQGAHLPQWKVGEVVHDAAFQSVSFERKVADNFNAGGLSVGGVSQTPNRTLLEIEVPAGTPMAHVSSLAGGAEAEAILARNTGLKVMEVRKEGELSIVRMRAEPPPTPSTAQPATEFQDGLETLQQAEQAHFDLAQAVRPYLDDVSGGALDDAVRGMDEAVGKQDEIVADVMARNAEAAVGEPGGVRQRGGTGEAIAAADLLASAAGLPNSQDIPVVGPMLSAYLKFRAASGALGKLGIRLPGSVARIAHLGASAQDGAATAVRALVHGVDKAAPVIARSSASLSSVLSRPLWEPLDDEKPARRPAGEPAAPKGKPDPQKLFRARAEELERVASNPEEAKRQILESIPAPPALAGAIADAVIHRLSWLAGQVPQDPRAPTVKPVPYRPSAAELQRFSDAVRASTEPLTVLHDLAIGAVSPVAALALREVFPRLFQQIQGELVEQVSEAERPMPYPMMTRLSLVFDVPLDNTMSPEYLARRREEDMVATQSAQPPASGPKMTTSSQSEFGAIRRAMR